MKIGQKISAVQAEQPSSLTVSESSNRTTEGEDGGGWKDDDLEVGEEIELGANLRLSVSGAGAAAATAAASIDKTASSTTPGSAGQLLVDDLSKTSTSPEGFDASAKLMEKEALIEQLEEEVCTHFQTSKLTNDTCLRKQVE